MMKFTTQLIGIVVLVAVALLQLSAQTTPDVLTGKIQYDKSTATKLLPHLEKMPVHMSLKKSAPTLLKIAGAKAIATMGNAYATINEETNQIAYDQYSGTTAVLYRGTEIDGTTTGNHLHYIWSSNHGQTWSAEIKSINIGTENQSGILRARHPSVILANSTKSTDRANVRLAGVWPQLNASWGEIRWAAVPIGASSTTDKGKMAKPPSGISWFIPAHPFSNPANGKLYSIAALFDENSSVVVYEYYLLTSADNGKTWTVSANPCIPEQFDKIPIHCAGDVSPDGSTIVISYVGANMQANGSYNVFDELHRYGIVKSTDGGVTWTDPEVFSIDDCTNINTPTDVSPVVYVTSDVVLDAKNQAHILGVFGGDAFYPRDSTYVVDMVKINNKWTMYKVANVIQPWVSRVSSARQQMMGEVNWAKSMDGNKIYAKWVDCDSSFKFPFTRVLNGTTVSISDSMHDVWMNAKDVRSNSFNGGWMNPLRLTNTKDIDEKQTKMPIYVGTDNRVDVVYTLWGTGENPDDDDVGISTIYQITDINGSPVTLSPTVGVNDPQPTPTEYALGQNYPNPFNPSTSISFTIPKDGRVKIRLFDLLGKELTTIVDRNFEAGAHRITFDAKNYPAGMYLYRMESGSFSTTKKMTVLK